MPDANQATDTQRKTSLNILDYRAKLAGTIQSLEAQLHQDLSRLDTIDQAIRVIDPEIDLGAIKPKRPGKARREAGATVFVLSQLRRSDQDQTARSLGVALAESRSHQSHEEIERAVQQVSAALQSLRKQGVVAAQKVGTGALVWHLTAAPRLQSSA